MSIGYIGPRLKTCASILHLSFLCCQSQFVVLQTVTIANHGRHVNPTFWRYLGAKGYRWVLDTIFQSHLETRLASSAQTLSKIPLIASPVPNTLEILIWIENSLQQKQQQSTSQWEENPSSVTLIRVPKVQSTFRLAYMVQWYMVLCLKNSHISGFFQSLFRFNSSILTAELKVLFINCSIWESFIREVMT